MVCVTLCFKEVQVICEKMVIFLIKAKTWYSCTVQSLDNFSVWSHHKNDTFSDTVNVISTHMFGSQGCIVQGKRLWWFQSHCDRETRNHLEMGTHQLPCSLTCWHMSHNLFITWVLSNHGSDHTHLQNVFKLHFDGHTDSRVDIASRPLFESQLEDLCCMSHPPLTEFLRYCYFLVMSLNSPFTVHMNNL